MNERPWPIVASAFPLLNPTATTPVEIQQNWGLLNNIIEQQNGAGPPGQQGPSGSGTKVRPYDGVSPKHDNVPWVITNGVLEAWPGSTYAVVFGGVGCFVATSSNTVIAPANDGATAVVVTDSVGGPVCTFDTGNHMVIPKRLILPLLT